LYWECISKTGQVIFIPEWPKGSLLVFWPYSVFGQNHLYVKMLQTEIPLFRVKKFKFPVSRPDDVSSRPDNVPYRPDTDSPASSVRTTCSFSLDTYTISRIFCASLLPSGRFSSTSGRYSILKRLADSFQVPRKGRSINRPDDVVYRPDAYLHKARIAVQT
jgi:hypothetical protein